MSVLIGVSASVQSRYSTFSECLANLQRPNGSEVMFAMGIDIGENRNKIVRHALENDFRWVFFLDDDMVFESGHLERLLSHNRHVIASLYLNRKPPHGVMAFNENTWVDGTYYGAKGVRLWKAVSLEGAPSSGLADIVAAGTGGMLISAVALRSIEHDTWFDHFQSTDDLAFCQRVIEAGFPIYLDLGATMGHISTHEVWPRFTDEWNVGYKLSDTEEISAKLAP